MLMMHGNIFFHIVCISKSDLNCLIDECAYFIVHRSNLTEGLKYWLIFISTAVIALEIRIILQ